MQCMKCLKEMDREDGGVTLKGIEVTIRLDKSTPENIAYNNKQMGKYSDGLGGCVVAICYECYVDTLFHLV